MNYLLHNQYSERLTFRLLQKEDYPAWLKFFKSDEATQYLALDEFPTAEAKCDEWFEKCRYRYENKLGGLNALVDRYTNQFIGMCGLLIQEVDGKREFEIGYSILPAYWGRGYALEAASKCRDFAFENDLAEYLISIIHKENEKSVRVAIKNGMTLWKSTEFWNLPVNVYRINKKDWYTLEK